jgi:hypothetical protein
LQYLAGIGKLFGNRKVFLFGNCLGNRRKGFRHVRAVVVIVGIRLIEGSLIFAESLADGFENGGEC